jgi:hypothetical protein
MRIRGSSAHVVLKRNFQYHKNNKGKGKAKMEHKAARTTNFKKKNKEKCYVCGSLDH